MGNQHKKEYPPLLAEGLRPMRLDELRRMCVDEFPNSQVRQKIMAGLERFVDRLLDIGIDESELWVDGSFLTSKESPEDADLLLIAPSHFLDAGTNEQIEVLEALGDIQKKQAYRAEYLCDTHSVLEYPPSSILRVLSDATIAGFNEDFGHSYVTRDPKGIAVIAIKQPQAADARGAGA